MLVGSCTCALSTPSFRELDGEGSEPKGASTLEYGMYGILPMEFQSQGHGLLL